MRAAHVPALIVGCAAAVVAGLAGAGPVDASSSIAAKSASEILAASKAAMSSASSFRVQGSVTSGSLPLTVDLNLGRTMAMGTLVVKGGHLDARLVKGSMYLRGDAVFYEGGGASTSVVSRLAGRWISVPTTSSTFSSLSRIIDKRDYLARLYTSVGTLTKGHVRTVHGHPTITVFDHRGNRLLGTLYVATTGKPYALELVTTGNDTYFSAFNKPVEVRKPSGTLSYSNLG